MPMRSRFRFWLKKRGARRSGSPGLALSGELLYYTVFIVVGAGAMTLHAVNVLAPSWRLGSMTADYLPATCRVVAKSQPAEGRQPQCRVKLLLEDGPDGPVWAIAGEPGLSLPVARSRLARFEVGEEYPCWYSPNDPTRVTLERGRRVWPWLVMLIPFSLILLGVIGMVRAVLQAGVSPERRHSVAQSAGRLEAVLTPTAPLSGSALPDTLAVTDSPGVRLKYRLPSLGDSGWRVATLAAICVIWNLMVVFFLVGIIIDFWSGAGQWSLVFVIAPLVLAGGSMITMLFQDARKASGVGVTNIELGEHPLLPGRRYQGMLIQSGHFRFKKISVFVVCEELATFCEGTDTRTSVEEVYREAAFHEHRHEVSPGRPYEKNFEFEIPLDAMPSFKAAHNEVRWCLEVRAAPIRWPRFERKFLICVYPAPVACEVPTKPATAAGA